METKPLLLYIDSGTDTGPLDLRDKIDFRVSRVPVDEAVSALEASSPAAVLCDVREDVDIGVALCQSLRHVLRDSAVPIVILSEVNKPELRTRFFRAGADDFLVYPADPEELSARLEHRMRPRSQPRASVADHIVLAGRLRLDLERVEARIEGAKVPLGPVEFKILSILARSLGQLRSRQEIEAFVWGDERPASRALDPHINALRKKLFGSGLELRTVYGSGYTLRVTKVQ